MQAIEVPTPIITCQADGTHIAICPGCGQHLPVLVSDVPVLETVAAADGSSVQVARGYTSLHDLSAFTTHFETEH